MRMSERYVIAALKLLVEQVEHKAISASMFSTDFCAPLRTLEVDRGTLEADGSLVVDEKHFCSGGLRPDVACYLVGHRRFWDESFFLTGELIIQRRTTIVSECF